MKRMPSARKIKQFMVRWLEEHPESHPAITETLENWRPGIDRTVAAMREADAALEYVLTADDIGSAFTYLLEHPLKPDAVLHLIIASQDKVKAANREQHRKHVKSRADAKNAKDPKQAAMNIIRAEFDRWQLDEVTYDGAADFAIKMHAKHSAVIEHERSIENAVGRWKEENHRVSSVILTAIC